MEYGNACMNPQTMCGVRAMEEARRLYDDADDDKMGYKMDSEEMHTRGELANYKGTGSKGLCLRYYLFET